MGHEKGSPISVHDGPLERGRSGVLADAFWIAPPSSPRLQADQAESRALKLPGSSFKKDSWP